MKECKSYYKNPVKLVATDYGTEEGRAQLRRESKEICDKAIKTRQYAPTDSDHSFAESYIHLYREQVRLALAQDAQDDM